MGCFDSDSFSTAKVRGRSIPSPLAGEVGSIADIRAGAQAEVKGHYFTGCLWKKEVAWESLKTAAAQAAQAQHARTEASCSFSVSMAQAKHSGGDNEPRSQRASCRRWKRSQTTESAAAAIAFSSQRQLQGGREQAARKGREKAGKWCAGALP